MSTETSGYWGMSDEEWDRYVAEMVEQFREERQREERAYLTMLTFLYEGYTPEQALIEARRWFL